MARMPVLQPTLLFDLILQDSILSESRRCAPEDGTNANAATIRLNLWDHAAAESLPGRFSAASKHTRQLLVGSPCLHYCNTKPSLPRTTLLASLRNHRRNCKDRPAH